MRPNAGVAMADDLLRNAEKISSRVGTIGTFINVAQHSHEILTAPTTEKRSEAIVSVAAKVGTGVAVGVASKVV